MKRMLFCFLLGVGTGGFGHWYFQQESGKKQLEQARAQVVSNAQMVATTLKDTFNELTVDEIKEEMARTSMVVREKAKVAGQSIASATTNARITASIKTKLISKKHVKQFALDMASNRAHKFTRVGGDFFIKCEGNMKEFIRNYVQRLPSKGKTIT